MAKQDPQHQSAPKQRQPYQEQGDHPPADPAFTEAVQKIADSPAAKPGETTDKTPAKSNSQLEAERNITRRLMEAALQEVKALPRPWEQLSEDEQDEVIHRIRCAANEVTAEVIATVAAGASKARAIVDIDGVNVKAKVAVVTLKLTSTNPAVHDIIGARGEQAVLVMGSDPTDYGINRDGITPDADQRSLPIA